MPISGAESESTDNWVSSFARRRPLGQETTISPDVVFGPLRVLSVCADYKWDCDC